MTSIADVTEADFDAVVLASDRPVLVDFWADWCAPCRMLAPTLEDMAVDYTGEVAVAKVDIVANADIARRFGVQSIPVLILFRDGREVARSLGAISRTRLAAFIEDHTGTAT